MLLSGVLSNAQTVTITSIPKAGDSLEYRGIDTNDVKTIQLGTTGSNKTWNFSSLNFKIQSSSSTNYLAPSAAILAAMPNATYTSGSSVFEVNNNGVYEIGTDDPTKFLKRNLVTPLNITSGLNKKDSLYFFGDTSILFFATFTAEYSGTLTTKKGTFSNVIVQHSNFVSKNNFTIGGKRGKFVSNKYFWYKPNYRGYIFEYSELSRLDSITGALVLTDRSANALVSSNISATSDLEINSISSIFPNPTSALLNISIKAQKSERVLISIVDITGKEWKAFQENINQGDQTLTINVNDLNAGGYFLIMKDVNGTTLGNSVFIKN